MRVDAGMTSSVHSPHQATLLERVLARGTSEDARDVRGEHAAAAAAADAR